MSSQIVDLSKQDVDIVKYKNGLIAAKQAEIEKAKLTSYVSSLSFIVRSEADFALCPSNSKRGGKVAM